MKMQEWEGDFEFEFFNSDDDVAEFYCKSVNCSFCNGRDMNGEPEGYGCLAQEDFIEENIHKVLSERADAVSDIKAFIQAQIDKAREEERNEIIKFCEEHRTVRKVNGVRYINIEQLKAKYKVVE